MERRTLKAVIILSLIIVVTFLVSLTFGIEWINIFDISDDVSYQIVMQLRLPRTIAALTSGMTLALSGMLIQMSLKNQLADSSILGFQSGATLFALLVLLVFPNLYVSLPLIAFIGGMLVYLIVFVIASRLDSGVHLIIVGIAISAVIRSFINILSLLNASELENTVLWTNGSLAMVSLSDSMVMLVYSIILIIVTILMIGYLDFNLLDDEMLLNLGLNYNVVRFLTATLAILLASVSVSFVGTIGFVGLLAPHIARRLVTNTAKNMVVMSMLVGGLLVLGCDVMQRVIFPIYEVPVGILMSFIGGSFLIILLLRRSSVKL